MGGDGRGGNEHYHHTLEVLSSDSTWSDVQVEDDSRAEKVLCQTIRYACEGFRSSPYDSAIPRCVLGPVCTSCCTGGIKNVLSGLEDLI